MSNIFNPSRNAAINAKRNLHGYVSRLLELPYACDRYEGMVVFCGEDKKFYECQHLFTNEGDYYRWIAVTTGGQRAFFVPVEALTETELPNEHTMIATVRTCCFDAIASAIDEIAIGLYRYGYNITPLCYKPSPDTKYVEGRIYYVYQNTYDRADYVPISAAEKASGPVPDKIYYTYNEDLRFVSIDPNSLDHFDAETTYFESKRPMFVRDPANVAGNAITHRVFVSNGQVYNELTKKELVKKLNEIINIVNVTGCRLDPCVDEGTLFDLCETLNLLIDELNPFAIPWNNLLSRVTAIEQKLRDLEIGVTRVIEMPADVLKDGNEFTMDFVEGSGSRMVTVTAK